ncbi:MAG TPA: ABC transporter permease [Bryobacteraceae bacterium]|jgi:putative ABC transport system permease protein|nr:ABC transporter permease [Bryobacteraceae bacterium]
MKPGAVISIAEKSRGLSQYFSDLPLAAENLLSQKIRTALTGLGMVFGVGAVIGMLAIGAGARQESLRFIEELGVRNLLVEARPAAGPEEFQVRRRSSPGLTERDVRILQANIDSLELISPSRTLRPSRLMPKPPHDPPELYGVQTTYATIHNLETVEGNFFSAQDQASSAAVCVLGEKAKVDLLGYGPAVGKFVKANDTWLQVVGVLGRQLSSGSTVSGGQVQDKNNVIYTPLTSLQYRFWDNNWFKDDLDGIDMRLKPGADSIEVAKVVSAVLNSTHHNIPDFGVIIPADLLAQQQRTQTIFTYVMVAIAAISLLVGGIGIMNIVLATVMERTREIGVRRATGARRNDIVRQFLTESVLISVGGGALGIAFGYLLSWLIARTAEWKTIVTTSSIFIAFGVSVAVGVIFGIYPAVKASRVDPIEALRYE